MMKRSLPHPSNLGTRLRLRSAPSSGRNVDSSYGLPRRRFIGLRIQATLLIGCAGIAATQINHSLYMDQMRALSLDQQKDRVLSQGRCIAHGIEFALVSGAIADLTTVVHRFVEEADVSMLAIFDPQGQLLVHAGHSEEEASLRWRALEDDDRMMLGSARYRNCKHGNGGFLEADFPLRFNAGRSPTSTDDPLFGYVRIGTSKLEEGHRLRSALSMTSGVGLMSLLATITLAFLVARQLVLPINNLTQTAQKLAAGDLSARSSVKRIDEIGDLADAFNQMASKLQRSHKAITQLNADLENRVRERTEHLTELAHHDPLTGLHNRRHFDQQLQARFEETQRYGSDFSCMMIDVDGFKGINDRLGHAVGDEVLRGLGRVISETVRSSDLAARYGGDEFVILLPHTDAFSARLLGERILERFNAAPAENFPSTQATLSMGVATASESDVSSADALLRSADLALYEAKRRGKNRLLLAHAMS